MSTPYASALAAYLEPKSPTQAEFAERIGATQATVSRYATGERFPDAKAARAIETHSGGNVPFAIWQREFLERSGLASRPSSEQAAA